MRTEQELSELQREGCSSGIGHEPSFTEAVSASEGISVAAIRSFYDQYVKDIDCTTGDMLTIVKRITKTGFKGGAGLSYCQHVRDSSPQTSSAEVGPATVFISHAWKYNFRQFLTALEVKFKGQPLVRLWIDLFCQNQHEELTSDDWITKFEQHIVRINNTVMIVFPWNKPIPFTRLAQSTLHGILLPHLLITTVFITRAWCLLEVFYSIKNGVPVEVYLTEEQQRQFLEDAQTHLNETLMIFSHISTRQSTCWVLNDQLRIHSLIESSVGFDYVDDKVRQAIAQDLQKAHPYPINRLTTQPTIHLHRRVTVDSSMELLKESLVRLFRDNGKLEESQAPSSIDVIFHYDELRVSSD